MSDTYSVYKHTSPSGKVYIGITSRPPEERWHGGSGYRRNKHFYNAIVKYGWINFTHEILAENLTHDEACTAEMALIAAYNSTDPAKGYNLAPGGHAPVPTEATRQKMRESHSRTPEWCRAQSERMSGEKNPFFGKTHTTETRVKMRLTKRKNVRPIICIDTGEVYLTLREASRQSGINATNISRCCRGIYKQVNGYHWRYLEEDRHGSI